MKYLILICYLNNEELRSYRDGTLRPWRKFFANFAVNGFRLFRQPFIQVKPHSWLKFLNSQILKLLIIVLVNQLPIENGFFDI